MIIASFLEWLLYVGLLLLRWITSELSDALKAIKIWRICDMENMWERKRYMKPLDGSHVFTPSSSLVNHHAFVSALLEVDIETIVIETTFFFFSYWTS